VGFQIKKRGKGSGSQKLGSGNVRNVKKQRELQERWTGKTDLPTSRGNSKILEDRP